MEMGHPDAYMTGGGPPDAYIMETGHPYAYMGGGVHRDTYIMGSSHPDTYITKVVIHMHTFKGGILMHALHS